jgi:hypothetical protein
MANPAEQVDRHLRDVEELQTLEDFLADAQRLQAQQHLAQNPLPGPLQEYLAEMDDMDEGTRPHASRPTPPIRRRTDVDGSNLYRVALGRVLSGSTWEEATAIETQRLMRDAKARYPRRWEWQLRRMVADAMRRAGWRPNMDADAWRRYADNIVSFSGY